MKKESGTLLYQFGIIFFIFGLLLIFICGCIAYYNEASTYKEERLDMLEGAGSTIESFIKEDSQGFLDYVRFYKEHCADMKIDVGSSGYKDEYDIFMKEFTEAYPGKVFGVDVMASELPYEMQLDYYEYQHEYWLSVFKNVWDGMGLMYVYFIIPDEVSSNVLYVCDIERVARDDGYMMLGDNVFNDRQKFAIEWDVWLNGRQDRFQVLDNEWGHVYTYYEPVIINHQKVGMIGIDIQFDTVNKQILMNTVELMLKMFAVMLLCLSLLLVLLYYLYLKGIIILTGLVKEFSDTKDPCIADDVRSNAKGNNEVTQLSLQIADMMESIDNYIRSLFDTSKALGEAQREVIVASNNARKDPLTGVRNKRAYDEMCRDIDYKIADGFTEFGIVMIDLNFLKRINDTYGHDRGNIAIKELCKIICQVFSHSPVFRIGGDEFAVILENEDFVNHDAKFMEFQGRIAERSMKEGLPTWERISAAAGKALFNPEIDQGIDNVFKRADNVMYENKKNMKALRG